MTTPSRRRWYQFSLRTFFVLVTLVCIGFGWWVHRSKEWIRQRDEILDRKDVSLLDREPYFDTTVAPGLLWIFGERGVEEIEYSATTQLDQETVQRLFPEAKITLSDPPGAASMDSNHAALQEYLQNHLEQLRQINKAQAEELRQLKDERGE